MGGNSGEGGEDDGSRERVEVHDRDDDDEHEHDDEAAVVVVGVVPCGSILLADLLLLLLPTPPFVDDEIHVWVASAEVAVVDRNRHQRRRGTLVALPPETEREQGRDHGRHGRR